ncbi:MAG TPA: hypothetical protein VM165_05565, partial [Planctomycetaceae bacterium]|nr:hypothetical protein [Planctomycetaceae bacterium]
MSHTFTQLTLLVTAAGLLAGCARSGPNPAAKTADPASVPEAHDHATSSRRGAAGERIPVLSDIEPHPAVAAVQGMLAAVRDGRLAVAYDFLPPGYQSDVDQIIQEAAAQVEPELWQAVARTAHKGLQVLREKKPLILESLSQPERQASIEQLAAAWDGLVSTVTELETGLLADLEQPRRWNSRLFLETTGSSLFRRLRGPEGSESLNPLAAMLEPHVTEEASPDGRLILRIRPPGQDEDDHVEFVQIENRWIPRSLADGWPEMREAWRRRLSPGHRESQQRVIAALAEIEASFDQMLAATSVEEFQTAAVPLGVK